MDTRVVEIVQLQPAIAEKSLNLANATSRRTVHAQKITDREASGEIIAVESNMLSKRDKVPPDLKLHLQACRDGGPPI